MKDAYEWRVERDQIEHIDALSVPTNLTSRKIEESFAQPDTMSFWALPSFIALLENSGFSATKHRLYFDSLLAQPFLLCAMVLIAATFSLRMQRRGGTTAMLVGGIVSGFLLWFLKDVIGAMGSAAMVPVVLAALDAGRRQHAAGRHLPVAPGGWLTGGRPRATWPYSFGQPPCYVSPPWKRRPRAPARCDRKRFTTASLAAAAGLGALLVLAGTAADAQEAGGKKGKSSEGSGRSPVLFSADEVTYDDQLEVTIARGNVELSQSGRTLLADVVSYNQRTDTVIASGNVSLIEDATGQTTFANYVELDDNMRDGFVKDVRMLLADRSRLAGNAGRRTSADRTEIRNGVYSPCDLCQTDPTQAPLWQLRAGTIIHHRADQLVEYENVELDIDGFPLMWAPLFLASRSDREAHERLPAADHRPEFHGPRLLRDHSLLLGAGAGQGPDARADLHQRPEQRAGRRISPALFLWHARHPGERHRFGSHAGGTPGNHDDQLRGNINAKGMFDLDDNWRTGFDIERTSDIPYLQEYKLGGYENFLNSSAFVENFDGRNYGSVFAYDFQSLQLAVPDRTQPIVLPVADYTWAGRQMSWGRFTTNVDAIDIVRETGPTERRLSVGTEYDEPFTFAWGQRFNFVMGARADGYHVTAQPLGTTGPIYNGLTGRFFPQAGLEWRYPWALQSGDSSFIIEPMAAFLRRADRRQSGEDPQHRQRRRRFQRPGPVHAQPLRRLRSGRWRPARRLRPACELAQPDQQYRRADRPELPLPEDLALRDRRQRRRARTPDVGLCRPDRLRAQPLVRRELPLPLQPAGSPAGAAGGQYRLRPVLPSA